MNVIRPGHKYTLASFENPNQFQVLQFIEKEPRFQGSNEMVTINDGTTTEEVLAALIDRTETLNAKFPSEYNANAITHMKAALQYFEERTASRKARGVEGKPLA